ncbi:ABC transporter substrate-binding protein/permease [Lacticaseibacillus nasuensis]|uniref:ABC transporter substrate-binding protein/permease n=1 Tax=Lacticaseibacillus nasuensis TaxID=944671 RepID=UPI002245848F|nr:ABC transporter substrate-binding protein/permease [Lacticaseibacillus nasuensis]MCX2456420.1 ABC transporter substrate-binding protein/permease [Lacticaseibacillus nasuensis]
MHKLKIWLLALVAGLALLIGGTAQQHAVQAAGNQSRLSTIQKRGYLIVGLSADYAPLEFHATVNGNDKIVGSDVSLAEKIAADMGVKLQIKEMGFNALIGAMKTGKIDLIISGMSDTAEREKEVSFSKWYTSEKQVMVIQTKNKGKYKNIADFDGASVGVQKQSIQQQLAETQLPGADVHVLDKANDVIAQVSTGKLEAGVMSQIIADSYAARTKGLSVIDPGFATEVAKTSVALPKGDTVLQAQINKSIDAVRSKHLYKGYLKAAYKLQDQDQSFWDKYHSYFVKGALYTLIFALITVISGTILGTALALMRRSKLWILKAIAVVYVEFIRGTPLMVQAFIVYFGTQVLGLNLNAFAAGAVAMGINSGAYVAEIIRSGLNSVPIGQTEAARSLGLSGGQTTRYVILPQAVKNIWPALGNEFVTVIKESSVLSVIGATELMFEGTNVQGASFKPFLPMIIVALIYFAMTFVFSRILGFIEKKFN